MPIIDMPLNDLKEYMGTNPCPSDFDSYWHSAIEEMHGVDPEIELIPNGFNSPDAECFDLYFTGVGGARIHAKYLRPTRCSGKAPAVMMFHGYSSHSGDWVDKLPYAAAGFHVAALDCRGQGGLSNDVGGRKGTSFHGHIIRGLAETPCKLLFRDVFLDTAQLASIIMSFPDVDKTRIGAMGASQGGGLTLACAALVPEINRLAPIYPFLCDYKRVWEMDLAENAYRELVDYFRLFDPLHEHEDEVFTKLGYIDLVNLAGRIKGKTLMATGLMDKICPPSTQFAAYNHISSQKDMLLYHDFAHESLPRCNDLIYQFMMEMNG